METFKSARFWLAIISIAGAFGMVWFDKVQGSEAIAFVAGVLGGFGVAKVSGKSNANK